jgi:hypothetical protein
MQGFDGWPGLQPPNEIERLIANGHKELNRGICGTKGVPAIFYARELLKGPMYPGTLSAFGSGIHLSTTSESPPDDAAKSGFPRCSKTAMEYACGDDTGVVLRCVLKPESRILETDEIRDIRRDNKNRAREAQLNDFGALVAALGFDGFLCDKVADDQTELWYVIVNRTVLTFQNLVLLRGHKPEPQNEKATP